MAYQVLESLSLKLACIFKIDWRMEKGTPKFKWPEEMIRPQE